MANLDDLLKKFDLEKGSTKLTTNERMRKEIKEYITDPKQFEKRVVGDCRAFEKGVDFISWRVSAEISWL